MMVHYNSIKIDPVIGIGIDKGNNMKLQLRIGNELLQMYDFLKLKFDDIVTWNAIEIGCFNGESTYQFLEYFKFNLLYCIDPWMNGYDNNDPASKADMNDAENNFNIIMKKYNNVNKLKSSSLDVVT